MLSSPLLILVVSFGFHLNRVKKITYMEYFEFFDQIEGRRLKYKSRNIKYLKDQIAKIQDNSIVFMGGSSLVLPGPCTYEEGKTNSFVERIASHLKKEKIINLGVCGAKSYDLLGVLDAIQDKKIKLLVVYTGHNDSSDLYQMLFSKQKFVSTRLISDLFDYFGNSEASWRAFYYSKEKLEPFFITWKKKIHDEYMNEAFWSKIEPEIMSRIFRRLELLITRLRKLKTKVLFIPAVGNITYPIPDVEPNMKIEYLKAMKNQNISRLTELQDKSRYGYDKILFTKVREEILAQKDFSTLDLRPYFTYNDYRNIFSDIFHFTSEGHEKMKNILLPIVKKELEN